MVICVPDRSSLFVMTRVIFVIEREKIRAKIGMINTVLLLNIFFC